MWSQLNKSSGGLRSASSYEALEEDEGSKSSNSTTERVKRRSTERVRMELKKARFTKYYSMRVFLQTALFLRLDLRVAKGGSCY